MTNNEYLKKMNAITEILERISVLEPFDQAAWDAGMDDMHMVTCQWHYNRRRRPMFFVVVCWVLAILLGLVVMSVCC